MTHGNAAMAVLDLTLSSYQLTHEYYQAAAALIDERVERHGEIRLDSKKQISQQRYLFKFQRKNSHLTWISEKSVVK